MDGRQEKRRERLSLRALNAPSAGASCEEEKEISWRGMWGKSLGKGGRRERAVAGVVYGITEGKQGPVEDGLRFNVWLYRSQCTLSTCGQKLKRLVLIRLL